MIENIIIGGRGSGKTTKLIRMSAENNIYIVCLDRRRALNIAAMAREMGLTIPFPITVEELPITRKSSWFTEVYVDDADQVLERLIGVRVSNITLEGNVENLKRFMFNFAEESDDRFI